MSPMRRPTPGWAEDMRALGFDPVEQAADLGPTSLSNGACVLPLLADTPATEHISRGVAFPLSDEPVLSEPGALPS
jgi:hypothetical protein